MGVPFNTVQEWLKGYDASSITIGVVASHSSLQILHGARQEGFGPWALRSVKTVDDSTRRFPVPTRTSG